MTAVLALKIWNNVSTTMERQSKRLALVESGKGSRVWAVVGMFQKREKLIDRTWCLYR